MLVSYSVIGLRYRAATTKCLLSWNCAGAGVGPRPPLGTGSLDPLESRSRLGLWVQGGMQENIAIAGFGIKVYREGVKPGLPAHSEYSKRTQNEELIFEENYRGIYLLHYRLVCRKELNIWKELHDDGVHPTTVSLSKPKVTWAEPHSSQKVRETARMATSMGFTGEGPIASGALQLGELIDEGNFSKVFRAVATTASGEGHCCAVKVTVCSTKVVRTPPMTHFPNQPPCPALLSPCCRGASTRCVRAPGLHHDHR